MSFQETFITLKECRVRIRRKGQGTPMIYLHGADGAAMIQPFMETLAQSYDLIVPEHPGFGQSDETPWLENMHDLAYYYLDLLDHLLGRLAGHGNRHSRAAPRQVDVAERPRWRARSQ